MLASDQKDVPKAGSESDIGDRKTTQPSGSESRELCLTLRGTYSNRLLPSSHTRNFYYALPLSGHAYTYVRYLKHHTQAQLTHALSIGINKLYYF
jgi:hypothetical protein